MGVPGVVSKAASGIIKSSPLGGVFDAAKGLGSALGIGPSEAAKRNKLYVQLHDHIRAGHFEILRMGITGAKWAGERWEAAWAWGRNSTDAAAAVAARQAAGQPRDTLTMTVPLPLTSEQLSSLGIDSLGRPLAGGAISQPSPTSVPPVTGKSKPTTSPGSGSPVTTSAPKPCKYGPRDPATGKCPTKGEAIRLGFISGPACKYGPRGADGKCPKKPRSARSPRSLSYWITRAATIGGSVAAAGASGAAKALKAAVASGEITWGEIAALGAEATGLVLAAAATGWFVGQDIARSLTGENAQLRIEKLNQDRLTARKQLEKQLGRLPTKDEQASITKEYEKRLWMVQKGSIRPPTDAELAASKADGSLYRTSNTPG